MDTSVIEIKNLTKSFKLYDKPVDRLKESLHPFRRKYHHDFFALHNINLNIQKGECIGIMGKNGSGKSTFLKLITGILTPTQGEIRVTGNVSALLELGTGFNPELTGIENIYMNGTIMGYTREQVASRIDSIVQFADIGDFIHQPVKMYSSGMFARLAFASAVSIEPEILIVDEVLSVGDLRFQIKCIEKMEELKGKGTTVLFVTHATEQIKRFCKRGLWFDAGHLKLDGDAVRVADRYEDHMLTPPEELNVHQNHPNIPNQTSPESETTFAKIHTTKCSPAKISTFDNLSVEVTYEIFEDAIPDLLLGVAIYGKGRKYLFGPNTYLDKIEIPVSKGIHTVRYFIPNMHLLSGIYYIDTGIFKNKGLVNLDYSTECHEFEIANDYFAEGMIYLEHKWEVIK